MYGIELRCLNLDNNDFEELFFGLFDDRFSMPESFSNPPVSLSTFEILIELHFDVFGWLDKGLAVNYNEFHKK